MEKAEQFVSDMSFEDFRKDDKTVFAVVRAMEVVGEAKSPLKKRFTSFEELDLLESLYRSSAIHQRIDENISEGRKICPPGLPSWS
jgi:uncharacterized protein with HEPN domain